MDSWNSTAGRSAGRDRSFGEVEAFERGAAQSARDVSKHVNEGLWYKARSRTIKCSKCGIITPVEHLSFKHFKS